MGKIYVIGMGPGEISQMTLGCIECIKSGRKNYLRTVHHPSVGYFDNENIPYESYDELYENVKDFNKLYEKIAEDLVNKADEFGEINYFVPGNPMVAEKTVEILIEKNANIEIISGLSFIEPMAEMTRSDMVKGLKIINGETITYRDLDIHSDIIITQVYNQRILSETKLAICEVYGDDYEVSLIHYAGIKGKEELECFKAYELDRSKKISHLSSIFIPKMPDFNKKKFDINDCLCIIEVLRGVGGCPWDRKQTHKSLRQALLEEAYELAYAIDEDSPDEMREELGDLLLHIIFHMTIAREEGEFLPIDVSTALAEKMIYRHPHVFGDNKEVPDWDKLKYDRRGINTISEKIIDIKGLPSLMAASKMWEKIEDAGISFEEIFPSRDDYEKTEEFWGDFFLKEVYKAGKDGVDSELSLQKAIGRVAEKLKDRQ